VSPDIAWGLFAATALVLSLTPGPDMIYVVSRAIAQGPLAGLISAAGLTVGLAAHTLLAALGVTALLKTSVLAFTVLKLAGAAYLVWIGVQMWRSAATQASDLGAAVLSPAGQLRVLNRRRLFWQGALSATLNPKLALFFLAFLPQFVPAHSISPIGDTLALGAVFAVIGISIQALAGVLAGSASRALRSNQRSLRWLFRGTGTVMCLLGLRLLFSPR